MIRYLSLALLAMTISACHHQKPLDESQLTPSLHRDRLLLDLRGMVRPDQVEGAYQRYNLQHVRLIDKSTNTWVFIFDTLLISPDKMIPLLDDSQFISHAEFSRD